MLLERVNVATIGSCIFACGCPTYTYTTTSQMSIFSGPVQVLLLKYSLGEMFAKNFRKRAIGALYPDRTTKYAFNRNRQCERNPDCS